MKAILFSLLCMLHAICFAATTIDVATFGAKPNTFTDATEYIKKAIANCKSDGEIILSFPVGRYDFWPTNAEVRNYFISNSSSEEECPSKLKYIGLLFENKKRIVIEGNGSLFVFHGKMITFAFDHCTDIKLQNIEVDFERPSMSELTFESVSDTSITAVIHPDSKFTIIDNKLKWYGENWGMNGYHAILVNPADSTLKYSSWDPFLKATATLVKTNEVRFTGDFKNQLYAKGTTLTIRDPVRDHVGMFINLCKNITLVNVQMHYMHGLGIISQFSENLLFDSVQVIPSHNRRIAAFADCLHFSGCRGFVMVKNCHFSGSHDDPINVHGTQLRIVDSLGTNTVKLRFMHGQTYGFPAYFAGDTVSFVHGATLQTYASAIVAEAKLINEHEMAVTFTTKIPAFIKEDCIENITWTPTFTLKNCLFENGNTRGVLVTTPRKVIIDNNVFSKTGMQAILIADDAESWYESGPVKDVTITNNQFINCGYNLGENNFTIAIAPENNAFVKGNFVHRNILIQHNVFTTSSNALLTAKSAYNLVFQNNIIHQSGNITQGDKKPMIELIACGKVSIRDNQFTQNIPAITIKNMAKKELITDIKSVTVLP